MRRIVFDDPRVGPLVARLAGGIWDPQNDRLIGMERDGEIVGGVIYTGVTGASCEILAAGEGRWTNHDLLWAVFHYPFVQLGLKKVFARVRQGADRALRFNLKLGFEVEVFLEDVFPEGGCFVLSMRREDCRWLGLRPRLLRDNKLEAA